MALANRLIIAAGLYDHDGKHNLRIVEETLSDNSKVYNVEVGSFEYAALNLIDAENIYASILKALPES